MKFRALIVLAVHTALPAYPIDILEGADDASVLPEVGERLGYEVGGVAGHVIVTKVEPISLPQADELKRRSLFTHRVTVTRAMVSP